MRIGMDASLKVCREEGYLMAEYKVRELYPGGVFDPDAPIRLYAHLPDYLKKEMCWRVGDKSLMLEVWLSANDVWEMYQSNKEEVDSLTGCCMDTFPDSAYSVLQLASDINAYCGLE